MLSCAVSEFYLGQEGLEAAAVGRMKLSFCAVSPGLFPCMDMGSRDQTIFSSEHLGKYGVTFD